MAQPIYKLYMFRNTEAWYQLSQDKQNELLGKVNAALEKAGGKRFISCNSSWSSEQWPVYGVEQFPNIEAVQQHEKALTDLNLSRYVVSKSMLGTELTPS